MTDTRRPSKEYHVRIFVRLSDDLLPQPVLSVAEVRAYLTEALKVGTAESPIVSVTVDDPRTARPKRY